MEDKNADARKQAQAQLESIKEMVAALNCDYDRLEELKEEEEELKEAIEEAAEGTERDEAEGAWHTWREENVDELEELRKAAGDCESEEDARTRIEEDALSVEVRSGWTTPGNTFETEEFMILLCTGGPAVRIRGELDQYNEPSRCWIEFQDWFTSWEELVFDSGEMETVLEYCRCFYFGE